MDKMPDNRGNRGGFEASVHRKKSFEVFDQFNWTLTGLVIWAHALSGYTLVRIFTGHISWKTLLFHFVLSQLVNLSCAVGVHRLWSHRSFKANLPLRIILMAFATVAAQGTIYTWARWHRQHHKYSDTPGDPHNSTRGFFFAHLGWFLMYDHQKFLKNSHGEIFTEDLERDEVVMWQYRNYYWFVALAVTVTPSVPWVLGWDSITDASAFTGLTITYLMHIGAVLNSITHSTWGLKPYDRNLRPSRIAFLSPFLHGEEDHNFHHTFPWDYKSSEDGSFWNVSMHAINFFYWMGLADDLKTASTELVEKRALRTGDGSFRKSH